MVKERRSPSFGVAYLVRGKDAGKPVWHYVLVDKMKLPLFERMLKQATLDLSQYGKILHSGWGINPPAEITKAIESQYS